MPSLGDIGEFEVIGRLTRGRRHGPHVLVGPGDDGAVVAADGAVVVSTDMLVQDRHFRLDWSRPDDVGRKALAQNAADIEAMGARVTAFVVAVGAPADTSIDVVEHLNEGLWAEASAVNASIVGGDLVAAPQLVISVTALGDLEGRSPVRLAGAHAGETVAIRGALGSSAAGYRLWQDGIDAFAPLRRAHLVPVPPYGQGRVAALGGATAMTDISDGLIADLGHVAAASAVGIELHTAALAPYRDALAPAAERVGADPWDWVLAGGEDHALVATFPRRIPDGWTAVGVVTGGTVGVTVDGKPWQGAKGWDSFA